jgi:hypothetical protein
MTTSQAHREVTKALLNINSKEVRTGQVANQIKWWVTSNADLANISSDRTAPIHLAIDGGDIDTERGTQCAICDNFEVGSIGADAIHSLRVVNPIEFAFLCIQGYTSRSASGRRATKIT